MHVSQTVIVSISKDWRDLYEAIGRSDVFPRRASRFSRCALRGEGGSSRANGAAAPILSPSDLGQDAR